MEIIGAIGLLLIGIIGYLLDQRNKKVDDSLKELQVGMTAVQSGLQITGQLNTFMNDRLKAVEAENATFRRSFHAFDLWLATSGRAVPHPKSPLENERYPTE